MESPPPCPSPTRGEGTMRRARCPVRLLASAPRLTQPTHGALVIVHAPPPAAGIEDLGHPQLRQVVGPRLGLVVVLLQIRLSALDRVLGALRIFVEVREEWLVKPVALVRRRAH